MNNKQLESLIDLIGKYCDSHLCDNCAFAQYKKNDIIHCWMLHSIVFIYNEIENNKE